jgi:hypothetical protein
MQSLASFTNGRHRLKLEDYDTLHPQKAVFVKESQLDFHSSFLSTIVDRPQKTLPQWNERCCYYLRSLKNLERMTGTLFFSSIPGDPNAIKSETLHGYNHRLAAQRI